jgi:hypothetical protein
MRISWLFTLTATLVFSTLAGAQSPTPSQTLEDSGVSGLPPQSSAPLADAPTPQPAAPTAYHSKANDSYIYHVGAFCGLGASSSAVATTPAVGCGAGLIFAPLPLFFEVGMMAPQANRSRLSAYISLDASLPLAHTSVKYLPFAVVGYSRLFETGHALDYGLALALPRPGKPRDPSSSLRIELRDYCTFANPVQHNVMLRIGWMAEESD